MPPNLRKPIVYLITSGETTLQTTPLSEDFSRLLKLVEAAVSGDVDLLQLREKNLPTKVLYELTTKAAELARGSHTRILVNDRADVALAAGACGVHLTTRSIETPVIRRTFGAEFLIGVSTHSLTQAQAARDGGANFAVFGPVFETASKRDYGEPLGLEKLKHAATALAPFPILALGGVTLDNLADCFQAGASGIAAIRLMNNAGMLARVVREVRARFREQEQ
jgi:thiamine-phosphate pyrophosphorylase